MSSGSHPTTALVPESASTGASAAPLRIEYCGEWFTVEPGQIFTMGRQGDLDIDDNPYLHRRFLEVAHDAGFWTLANIGDRIAATLADVEGRFTAHLRSGAVIPLVLPRTLVRFGAGATTYEIVLVLDAPPFQTVAKRRSDDDGTMTMGQVVLTNDQRLCILALSEPALRRGGSGASQLPASKDAARRLGWTLTKFNRKLDNVCHKLSRAGVGGLHGGVDDQANNRRARLVEYSISSGLVTYDDLAVLP